MDGVQARAGHLEGAARPPFARRAVLAAAAAQALALTAGSAGYGYHRDELYFRMLPAQWNYLDQPPLTPGLPRLSTHLADQVWALRLPATIAAALSVILLALITRDLGGGRAAQVLCAWGYAFAAMPLMLGHVLLTATIDLPLLLAVVVLVLRAVSGRPRTWLSAGIVAGVTAYTRLLVVVVVGLLVLGLVVLGPRATLRTPWPWLGGLIAGAIAIPVIAYQAGNDWPQLRMGEALASANAGEVRSFLPVLLLLMLGPPLVLVWVLGIGWLLRAPQRGRAGFLAVAFAGLVAFTLVSGAQPHYPIHLLSVMYAAGCVPAGRWLAARRRWRAVASAVVAVNAAVALVLALPVIPEAHLGATPIPGMAQLVRDQVGWPAYVEQIAAAHVQVADGRPLPILSANYGEAGAIDRYGPALGLPHPYSGHTGLGDLGPPSGDRVLVVGGQLDSAQEMFERCTVLARLDNGVDVDNEEQGQPIALCTGPRAPWPQLWPRLRHLD
ncbi:MAG: glycosyltransferase family 39 protein [Tetrasphaera sp.]